MSILSLNQKKVLVIGEPQSGKSWLWHSYFHQRVPQNYIETVFDNHTATISRGGTQVNISLFEVSGSDEYADLRKLLYPGTHLIIFCVGIDDHYLTKTKSRVDSWYKEFKQYCPGIPIFVVGTKKDIRDDVDGLLALAEKRVKPMKASDLSQLCKKFKGVAVLECSAKSGDGIEQVFHTAIKVLRHAK